MEGVVIQQVEVLPEELTVHLGSYGAGAGGNRPGYTPSTMTTSVLEHLLSIFLRSA